MLMKKCTPGCILLILFKLHIIPIPDTVIDTIVSVTVSAFLRLFYWKQGIFLMLIISGTALIVNNWPWPVLG